MMTIASHPARYQKPKADLSVQCLLCPHVCLIPEGALGQCGVRQNREGSLYTLSYNHPCSMGIDPVEKKPLFHFHPGEKILSIATEGCNFHCLNCQNWHISQRSPKEGRRSPVTATEIIDTTRSHSCKMIAFTYTEPTVFYEYMYDISSAAREKGLKTVMISNGYIIRDPLLALTPFLDAANIDLKSFDDGAYRKMTGGSLYPVLRTLRTLLQQKVWLEITHLLIPGYNDAPATIERMCRWLADNGFSDTPLHLSRFFPTYKLTDRPPTPLQTLSMATEIALECGIRYVYPGNISHTEDENTFCPNCKKVLIERNGFQLLRNRITKGHCPYCNEPIAGKWSD